jgi:hypothetical protein
VLETDRIALKGDYVESKGTTRQGPQAADAIAIGARAIVAQALSAQGLSSRSVAKISGISATSVRRLARKTLIPPEQAEAVRRLVRDQFVAVAQAALNKVTDDKLDESSALELTRIASLASQQGGLSAPSSHETYNQAISKYVIISGSAGNDSEPSERANSSQPKHQLDHGMTAQEGRR